MKHFIIFLLAIPMTGFGQQKPGVDKILQTTDAVVDAAKSIGDIFKKKNKGEGDAPVSVQGQAGRITENTLVVDCDFMNPFVEGAAIVKKGTAVGLINEKGEFIFPYNKFRTINYYGAGYIVADGKIYNSKGSLLSDKFEQMDQTNDVFNGDYLVIQTGKKDKEVIDITGKKRIIPRNGQEILGTVYRNCVVVSIAKPGGVIGKDYLHGLKDLDGKQIVPFQYSNIFEFKDGYACVEVKDEFGEARYGIIDDKGNVVIEPKYSNRLFVYGDGYFGVVAHASQDYKSGILNAKGEFIYKAAKSNASGEQLAECISGMCVQYEDGYFFNQDYIMDAKGKLYKAIDFLKARGLGFDVKTAKFLDAGKNLLTPSVKKYVAHDDCISFSYNDPATKDRVVGLFFPLENKLVIGGGFQNPVIFDPVSKLGFVTQQFKSGNRMVINKGYINEDGDFVMVMRQDVRE